MPYLGRQPGVGVRNRYIYTATASQTTFSGADDNGATLAYDDAAYVDVYLNGVLLIPVTDYAATTKTSVVLTSGAAASDLLEILAYEISSIADTVSKANGGTFDGAITVNGNFSADGGTIKLDGNYPVGTQNVALGDTALDSITTGKWNVALGHAALTTATNSNQQTAIGRLALTTSNGSDNTAVGFNAANANTSGTSNTAIGAQALNSNTTASNNTAVGYRAGYANTTGKDSVYLGRTAGLSATTAVANTFVGTAAGGGVTTGSYNTFIGSGEIGVSGGAGEFVTTGSKNTILGRYNGNQGGLDIRTASKHIVLSDGDGNPRFYIDENGKTFIGGDPNGGTAGTDTCVISNTNNGQQLIFQYYTGPVNWGVGANSGNEFNFSDGGGTRKMYLTSGGAAYNSSGTWGTISDVKLKENIQDASSQWDDIKALQVRKYSLISDGLDAPNQIGVIAQELEASGMSGLVESSPDIDSDTGEDLGTTTKTVKYSILYMKAVKALQEAMERIETLEAKVAALENA